MQHLQLYPKKQQRRNRNGFSLSLQSHPVVCVQYQTMDSYMVASKVCVPHLIHIPRILHTRFRERSCRRSLARTSNNNHTHTAWNRERQKEKKKRVMKQIRTQVYRQHSQMVPVDLQPFFFVNIKKIDVVVVAFLLGYYFIHSFFFFYFNSSRGKGRG